MSNPPPGLVIDSEAREDSDDPILCEEIMFAEEFPCCCALTALVGTDCLMAGDAFSKRERERINDAYQSEAAVLTVVDENKADYKRAAEFLLAMGWKHLGSSPGAHQDCYSEPYEVHLWGSKEFKVEAPVKPVAKKKVAKAKVVATKKFVRRRK